MGKLRWLAVLTSLGLTLGYGLERARDGGLLDSPIERGRFADAPWRIPWLGWRDVVARTWNGLWDDRLFAVAGSVAFFTLLSLAPSLSVLVTIYGFLADATTAVDRLAALLGPLPDIVRDLVTEQTQRLATQSTQKLTTALLVSFLVAAWSANAAVKALFDGLNVVYGEDEKRSFLHFNAVAMAATLCAIVMLALAAVAIALAPPVLVRLPLPAAAETLISVARWPAFYAIAAVAFGALYWLGPSRVRPRLVWILPGAIAAAVAWACMSAAFSAYVVRVGDLSALYGSLATIVIAMIWIWLSALVVLVGAKLNAELERQTMVDTTVGAPKPAGARGAAVADTAGPAVARSR
jgi:membrane protein